MTHDFRDQLFEALSGQRFSASVVVMADGIVAGMEGALCEAKAVGCAARALVMDGEFVAAGARIVALSGSPKALALAEECVAGALAKPSGIATATRELVERAGAQLQIVGGGWKKMPRALKEMVRHAVCVGGAHLRIDEAPFLYLDKNCVRMFGSVSATLTAVSGMVGYRKVIQLGDDGMALEEETRIAVEFGVSTIFVDTGEVGDLNCVMDALEDLCARSRVRVAFGGGVGHEHIDELVQLGVDALCIGRRIVDAPLLDMRLEIEKPEEASVSNVRVERESADA